MSKATTVKTSAAIATATLISSGVVAHADEVTQPTTAPATETTTQTQAEAPTQTEASKTQMEQAQNDVTSTKEVLDDVTEAEITTREDNASTLDKAVTDTETKLDEAKQAEATAKDNLDTAKSEAQVEEAKIQPQVDDLNAKTSELTNAQTAHSQAESDAQSAQDNLNASKAKATSLENTLTNVQSKQAQEERDLEAAKAADATRQSNIDNAQAEVNRLSEQHRDLTNGVATAKEKVATTKQEVTDAKADVMKNFDVTLSQEYIDTLKAFKASSTHENSLKLKAAAEAWLAANPYSVSMKELKNSDSRAADITNLTLEQLEELNVFASQIVEDMRTQMGLYGSHQLAVTKETVKLGQFVSKNYKDAIANSVDGAPSAWDAYDVGHLSSSVTIRPNLAAAGIIKDPNGRIPSTARNENLAYSTMNWAQNNDLLGTMGRMKAIVYKQFMDFMMDDYFPGWAHSLNLIGDDITNKDDARTQLELIFVQDSSYIMVGMQETKFDWDVFHNTVNTENLSLTPIAVPKTDSRAAKARLATALTEASKAETELTRLEQELAVASPELATAQRNLTAAQNVPIQTPQAERKLADAKANVATAQANLDNERAKLPALEKAVTDTRSALDTATQKLNTARNAYNDSKAEYDKVSASHKAALAKVEELQKVYDAKVNDRQSTEAELANAKQAIIDNNNEITRLKALLPELRVKQQEALDELATAKQTLDEAKVKLAEAKKLANVERQKIADAKADYDKAVDYLNSLKLAEEKRQAEIKKQAEAKHIEETQARMAKVQAIQTQAVAKAQTQKAAQATGASDKLPETGSVNSNVLAIFGLTLVSLSGLLFFKKKED